MFFEPDYEADLYEELRIRDWEDILRPSDIEDTILNPTTQKLHRVISIISPMYFERIYGAYIGLKNAGQPISGSVEQVMKLRKSEFKKGKIRSEIQITTPEPTAKQLDDQNDKIAALQKQVEQLTALLAQQVAPVSATVETADEPEKKVVRRAAKKLTKENTEQKEG